MAQPIPNDYPEGHPLWEHFLRWRDEQEFDHETWVYSGLLWRAYLAGAIKGAELAIDKGLSDQQIIEMLAEKMRGQSDG